MQLYYHKTSGGAEYLTDKFVPWAFNGKSGKEGVFKDAKYIVRIDGDITKDAELNVREDFTARDMAAILKQELDNGDNDQIDGIFMAEKIARAVAELLPKDEAKAFLKTVKLSKLK